jgi:hypothetical protein
VIFVTAFNSSTIRNVVLSESKVKKAISVRFDPADYASYSALVETAGLSVSDGLRQLVADKLRDAEKADMKGFNVDIEFLWKKPDAAFPEHVGNLLVKVSPPKGVPAELLQRLVFVIPEFWTDTGKSATEPFRIDSAYFHRVDQEPYLRTSNRTTRNVVSFHLIQSSWRAAVFDYGSGLETNEMGSRIATAITDHITQTIRCYLIGHLPRARILSPEHRKEMMEVYDENKLAQMMALTAG